MTWMTEKSQGGAYLQLQWCCYRLVFSYQFSFFFFHIPFPVLEKTAALGWNLKCQRYPIRSCYFFFVIMLFFITLVMKKDHQTAPDHINTRYTLLVGHRYRSLSHYGSHFQLLPHIHPHAKFFCCCLICFFLLLFLVWLNCCKHVCMYIWMNEWINEFAYVQVRY